LSLVLERGLSRRWQIVEMDRDLLDGVGGEPFAPHLLDLRFEF
jgi:hypothetical protein